MIEPSFVSRRRVAVRGLLVVVLAIAWVIGQASSASAHAILEATSPGDRAHLDKAPPLVSLQFSEGIQATLGAVRVFDGSGNRVDNGSLQVSGQAITLGLKDGLGDGAYVVTWRVISADTHPVRGAFTFTVGNAIAATDSQVAQDIGGGNDSFWQVVGAVGRWFAFGGTLLAAGGAVFLAVVHNGGRERRRLVAVVIAAAAVGAFGVLVAVPIQAALATGLGLGAVRQGPVLRQVLSNGESAAIAGTLIGLAAIVVIVRRPLLGATKVVAVIAAAIAAGSFVIAGHPRTTSPVWLAVGSDLAHLFMGAAWFGGIVLLALTLRARRSTDDPKGTAGIIVRFSTIATMSVVGVSIAGTALGWSEVRSFHALVSTNYGRLLIAKVVVVGGIALLGAYNHYRLIPALERAPKRAGALVARTVRFEAIAMVLVIAITAVLVNTTPARSAATAGIFSGTKPVGAGSVNLVVDPDRVGTNSIHMYLLDQAGRSFTPVKVMLQLSLPANQIGPISREPFVAGPGHYQLASDDLTIAGNWTIQVLVQTDKFTEQTVVFDVTVH